MSVRSNLSSDILPYRANIGLSQLIGITGLPGQISISIQYISGGTLEIASLGASIGWGQGWLVPAQSIVSMDLTSTLWLASSGATTSITVLVGRGEGFAGASFGFRG